MRNNLFGTNNFFSALGTGRATSPKVSSHNGIRPKVTKYAILKEQALSNFDLVLDYWGVTYTKINDKEYDFLSPNREDHNFGACRFNVEKGIGADFAGTSLSGKDYAWFGKGFTKDDFNGFTAFGGSTFEARNTFDVIGLCQRIHKLNDYRSAAELLSQQLRELRKNYKLARVSHKAVQERLDRIGQQKEQKKKWAADIWELCLPIKNSPAEKYLNNRGLFSECWGAEPAIKFKRIKHKETNRFLPAVVFAVSEKPLWEGGEVGAIHRVYLKGDGGSKIDGTNAHGRIEAKMALGSISGKAIWFGKSSEKLYVCEGPEEALTLRYGADKDFVVSTVYANNYHCLTIPTYVKEVVLVYDNDEAGFKAFQLAVVSYKKQGKIVKAITPEFKLLIC